MVEQEMIIVEQKTGKKVRTLHIETKNEEDHNILDRAINILSELGYTICKQTDLVLENE